MGLPFPYTAELQETNGDQVEAEIPCAVWPSARGLSGRGGRTYSHDGEAPARFAEQLRQGNRKLMIAEGPRAGTYRINDADLQDFLPHVVLQLTRAGN